MSARLARIFGDLRPHRRYAVWVIGCTLVYAFARIVPPLLARVLLDRTLAGRAAYILGVTLSVPAAVTAVPILLLSLAAALALAQYLMRLWSGVLGQRLVGDLQVRLLEHLLRVPAPLLERRILGTQLLRFNGDMTAVKRFVARSLPELVRDVMAVLVICVVLISLHMPLALVVAGVILAYLVLVLTFWRQLDQASRAVRAARSRISGIAFDRLTVASQVKLTRRERRETRRFRKVQRHVLHVSRRQAGISGWVSGASEVAVGIMVALSLGFGARSVLANAISRGEMVAFYGLVLMLISPLRAVSRTVESLAVGQVAFDRLYRMLDAPEERDPPDAATLRVTRGEIRLAGVQVRDAVFPDLVIPPGVSVLTGSPGSGISLLGQLLVRLQHPTTGTVHIDGIDVSGVGFRSLRKRVTYIPAMAPLLKGSVRLNLTAGLHLDRSDDILAALHAVGGSWATSETLQSPAGSAGRRLSPLQRWQVLCARACLGRPAIVVLDGPPVHGDSLNTAIRGLRAAGVRSVIVLSEHALPAVLADHTISLTISLAAPEVARA